MSSPRTVTLGMAKRLMLGISVFALAACAQIPTSGPIEQGGEVQASIDDPVIRVLVRPPEPGLSAIGVVQGFLHAEAGFDDDHAIARQFLTPEASAAWEPDAGVVIFDELPPPSFRRSGPRVTLTASEVAFISADGSLEPRSGAPFSDTFVMERTNGEWRIAHLRNGLSLTRLDVARSYRSFSLHFLAPHQNRLVPDPVFVPVDRSGAATSLVRSLLDGPTRWLAPAVETAVPAGTQLNVDAVPIENGVAQVDLSTEVLNADEIDLQRLAAQLVWTLTELPDVTGVSISVEGSPLQLPGVPNVQTEETWEQYDPNGITDSAAALIVRRGAIREIVGRRSIAKPGPLGRGRLQLSDPALSLDISLVVALASDRSRVVAQDLLVASKIDPVLSGTNFAAPSIDGSSAVWLADRDATGTHISWKPRDGPIESVAAPSLRGLHVVAMRAALDGTRVALVVRGRDGGGHLLLARVVQRSAGLQLQALRPLEERLTNVRDVTWSSASSLVALGRDRGSVLQPFQIGIDGSVNPVAGTTLQGIDGLSTAPGADLLASTSDGEIYKNKGVRWRALVPGRDPAYPG